MVSGAAPGVLPLCLLPPARLALGHTPGGGTGGASDGLDRPGVAHAVLIGTLFQQFREVQKRVLGDLRVEANTYFFFTIGL